ncbi:aldo/keto reductase [Streptomyces sp. NPDC001315]|uniref:aldo/keto reductase n=1 Tax=Streptomyces sp. NPDC001315 TaxID=3364562 RepID=UPI0036824C63
MHESWPSSAIATGRFLQVLGPHREVLGPVASGVGGADIRGLVEANLESPAVDRLDLLYLRIGLMKPPHGESLDARFEVFAALREEGLSRHLGLGNVDADHLAEARAIASVVAVQHQYTPISATTPTSSPPARSWALPSCPGRVVAGEMVLRFHELPRELAFAEVLGFAEVAAPPGMWCGHCSKGE